MTLTEIAEAERGPFTTLRDLYDAIESGDTVMAALAGAQWVEDSASGEFDRGEWLHNPGLALRWARARLARQLLASPPKAV